MAKKQRRATGTTSQTQQKKKVKKKALLSSLENENPVQLRELRDAEARIRQLQSELKLEQSKRDQAEQELQDSRERESILLATREQKQEYRISPPKASGKAKSPGTPVICCNDWHAEAKVDDEMVNNLNKFDLDICQSRIAKLWEKSIYLIRFFRVAADIRDAVLWAGGDMISGTIHEELEESNFLGPTKAVQFVVDRLNEGILYLLEHAEIERLHVVCNYGNHGRTTKKKRIATAYLHSYEWLAYNQLADRFRSDSRVTFQISNGYHAICEVQGWKVRFHHGDAIRYSGGVGGISIPCNKAIQQWQKSTRCDCDIFGHWHQFLDHYSWVSCGCLVGYDEFALSIKADFQEPTQTLVMFDRDKGKVAALPIFVR